jgi:Uma2 family endonuclease
MTIDEFYALPDDGFKHELQAGLLVSEPAPGARHGYTAVRVCMLLAAYVEARSLGVVLGNDSGFVLSRSPDTVRGPDVAFVRRERLGPGRLPVGPFPGAPDLAVEVLSPSNMPTAVRAKVAEYLAAGTKLVWVVDPAERVVMVYREGLAPRVLDERVQLDGEEVVPGFAVAVSELFERA